VPLSSFGLGATLVRLRNSDFQSSNSPRHLASAAQASGAAKGNKSQNHLNVAINGCSGKRMDIALQGMY